MNAPPFLRSASMVMAAWPLLFGCTFDAAGRADLNGGEMKGPDRLADDTFDPACCSQREFDLNRDNKPDAYTFAKKGDAGTLVVRRENDINFDGKIDLIRTLNDQGELVQERLDADFDGRVDLVIILEKGKIVRKEYDTNFDAKADMWRYFDKDAVARKEADLNYDGRVDYWEYFEGGKLDRVGIDRDADGNVDEWIQSTSEG